MSDEAHAQTPADREEGISWDMLLRVREVDPEGDEEAVRRYAGEIAEAVAELRSLDLDPSSAPLEATFSPIWTHGRA